MKKIILVFASISLFACKKSNDNPAPVKTAVGNWKAIESGFKDVTIKADSILWNNSTFDADSVRITSDKIIKEYRAAFPDTAFSYSITNNNDTLTLISRSSADVSHYYRLK